MGPTGNIVSEGVNSPPDRFNFSKADTFLAIERDPEWKYFMLEHAERNAINSAFSKGAPLLGATMYVSLYPCADCARAIVAAGISRLVVPDIEGDADRDTKWKAHYHYASKVFALAGVKVEVK